MEERKSPLVTKRALFVFLVVILGTALLFTRFIYIQAAKEVQGYDLQEIIEQRWSQTRVLEGKRGTIFDRNGDALAEEVTSYSVVAILDERYSDRVEDPAETARKLSTVLDIEQSVIEGYLTSGIENGRVQVELGPKAKFLSYETKEEIEALELAGIQLRTDPRRYYPKQMFASHILGYTERDMSEARMGLESSLNDYLQEEEGSISYQKDGRNRRLPNAEEIIDPPENGHDVYLTLDTRIQMAIEQTMNQVEEEFSPERVMTVVANAKTGEILGMSNRPSFNPNQYESIENYTNYNISSRFEPGSTMKIFTVAAAIEEGVYDGDALFKSGSYELGDHSIRDHYRGGWGEITYDEGFRRSSNVAMSILALDKLGPEKLYEYIDKFGFNAPTGIELPNEANSQIARQWRSDAATTSFGQGSAVTPIQQVQAATAIANNGTMMKPYVIDKIVNSDNGTVVVEGEPEAAGNPVSEETSRQVLELMETVVSDEDGTGRPYAIEGFNVAGKTGTAEIIREDGPGYMTGHGNFIYSFLGMAPAEDPEIIVYVAVDRPKLDLDEPGNLPVSMIFKSVMNQSLQYLNIAPTETIGNNEDEANILEDFTGSVAEEAEEHLTDAGLKPILIGEGTEITGQFPRPGMGILNGERVLLMTDSEEILMPDMDGWSQRYLFAFQELTGITAETSGNGFVYSQTPDPGTSLAGADRIKAALSVPGEREEEAAEVPEESGEEIDEADEAGEDGNEEEEEFFMD